VKLLPCSSWALSLPPDVETKTCVLAVYTLVLRSVWTAAIAMATSTVTAITRQRLRTTRM